jgi:hypothetical protein
VTPQRGIPTTNALAVVTTPKRVIVAQTKDFMTREQVLDLYFMDARSKLIDLAAFIDRVERASGEDDFRMKAFREALGELSKNNREKAKQVLLKFSDPTTEPIPAATAKGAVGAWTGK